MSISEELNILQQREQVLIKNVKKWMMKQEELERMNEEVVQKLKEEIKSLNLKVNQLTKKNIRLDNDVSELGKQNEILENNIKRSSLARGSRDSATSLNALSGKSFDSKISYQIDIIDTYQEEINIILNKYSLQDIINHEDARDIVFSVISFSDEQANQSSMQQYFKLKVNPKSDQQENDRIQNAFYIVQGHKEKSIVNLQLNRDEFRQMSFLIFSYESVERMLAAQDVNGNGKMDIDEFLCFMRDRKVKMKNHSFREFNRVDADRDGSLSLDEVIKFQSVFNLLNQDWVRTDALQEWIYKQLQVQEEENAHNLFKHIDVSNRGCITRDDFINWVINSMKDLKVDFFKLVKFMLKIFKHQVIGDSIAQKDFHKLCPFVEAFMDARLQFIQIDTNKDGRVNKTDFLKGLNDLALPKNVSKNPDDLFNEFEPNSKQELEIHQFIINQIKFLSDKLK